MDLLNIEVLPQMYEYEPEVEVFTSTIDGKSKKEDMQMELKLPRQMDSGTMEKVQAMADAAKATVLTFGSSSIILSIFFAGLLQYLWGFINTLQIIMITALFTIMLPSNAQMMMFTIMQLTNLDLLNSLNIVNLEEVSINMFGFTEEHLAPFNGLFKMAGFETTNFIIESGTLLFVIVGFGALLAIKKLARLIASRFSDNWLTLRLKKQ